MEKIKPKLSEDRPIEPIVEYDSGKHESYHPEPAAMLSSKEVRRQLGWFLTSNYHARDD